jgi:hypothetical protein
LSKPLFGHGPGIIPGQGQGYDDIGVHGAANLRLICQQVFPNLFLAVIQHCQLQLPVIGL